MNDEIGLLISLAKQLESAGFDYMVTGSMAMALYGRPRMTRDIDVVIHLTVSDVDRLTDIFKEEYCLESDAIRKAVGSHGMFNIIHYEQVLKIDFVVRKDEPYRVEEFKRRCRIKVADQLVYVVRREDLVLSKLVWAQNSASALQLGDAQQMLKMAGNVLDWNYMNYWAHTLGIDGLLEESKRDV